MEIAGKEAFAGPNPLAPTGAKASAESDPRQSFASFLKTQGDAAGDVSAATGSDDSTSPDTDEDDIAFIRKFGFQAYLERNHERKLEEMREKILIGMGLNEEMLAAMPADQRALIEKMIAEEIRARLAAEAEFNRGAERAENAAAGQGQNVPAQAVRLEPPGRMQALVGFSIVDAVTGPANLAGNDDDRQLLPSDD